MSNDFWMEAASAKLTIQLGLMGQEVPMVHDQRLEIQYNNRFHGLNGPTQIK